MRLAVFVAEVLAGRNCFSTSSASGYSKAEGFADPSSVLQGCRLGGVDLKIIGDVSVDTVELPPRQPDLAVATLSLPSFEHIE